MASDAAPDLLSRLAPGGRAPGRFRVRLGVGAAIVLLLTALVIAVLISAIGQQSGRTEVADTAAAASGSGTGSDPNGGGAEAGVSGGILLVHVLGAVEKPGLFELPDGSRVVDAVAAAGGMSATADPAGVNLARPVSDGEQLYLPAIGETAAAAPGAGSAPTGAAGAPAGKVNLNAATVADLDGLPRIGPALAQRIIDYRLANGQFSSVDDLRNVTGIGEKTFAGLKDLITT